MRVSGRSIKDMGMAFGFDDTLSQDLGLFR